MGERIEVLKAFFDKFTSDKVAKLEEDNAVLHAYVQELDSQVMALQAAVEALALNSQQMVGDMKIIYESLNAIIVKSEESSADKYFASIISNRGGGNLPH